MAVVALDGGLLGDGGDVLGEASAGWVARRSLSEASPPPQALSASSPAARRAARAVRVRVISSAQIRDSVMPGAPASTWTWVWKTVCPAPAPVLKIIR